MSTKLKIILVISALTFVALCESMLVIKGVLPPAIESIELKAPLYPKEFIYTASLRAYMGRGHYIIVIKPETNLSIIISCSSSPNESAKNIILGNISQIKSIQLYCETPIMIRIYAYMKPYHTRVCAIEVRRG